MFRATLICAAAMAGLLTAASAAHAAPVTETYHFTLGNFIDVGGGAAPPPIATISGAFTLTFDPDLFADNVTAGVVVDSLSDGQVASPIGYTNFPAGFGFPDFLSIGGIANDADFIAFGVDDFALTLKFFNPGHPQFAICDDGYSCGAAPGSTLASGYTLAGFPDSGWLPTSGSVSVPEPAAWSLMLLGFGLSGAALRGRARRLA